MLERAALHQTRFRTPGVGPDARGVVLGQRGLVLFPSLDRMVAFFRAYSEEASLDELIPSLAIRQLTTALRTRELMVLFDSDSSYRMDRIAATAKLAGGLLFTGTSRHFVKYRDAGSPLGYDVTRLLEEHADVVLYHDSFQQAYRFEREIGFASLMRRLTPQRQPAGVEVSLDRLYVTAQVGLGGALTGYLFRWRVDAGAALVEWPSESAFEDRPRRLYLFDLAAAPARMIELFRALPGVRVFSPTTDGAAVEVGYRHPVDLASCPSLFADGSLHLFGGDGQVDHIEPGPSFVPVRSLVGTNLQIDAQLRAGGRPTGGGLEVSVPLRLAPTIAPLRAVIASSVPMVRRDWLARILYLLPPGALAKLQLALTADRIYLLNSDGIEGVPIGTFFCEVASRIYVPAGMTLVPAVHPQVLEELVTDRGDGHVFFEPGEATPRLVPHASFGPATRRAIRSVAAMVVHADRPDAKEPPLPALRYGEDRRFPLWGLPEGPQGTPE